MFNWFLVFQSSVLALDESALDVDQVENLIKFCPTKEEMELLKVTSIINPSLYLKFCIFELIIIILGTAYKTYIRLLFSGIIYSALVLRLITEIRKTWENVNR